MLKRPSAWMNSAVHRRFYSGKIIERKIKTLYEVYELIFPNELLSEFNSFLN